MLLMHKECQERAILHEKWYNTAYVINTFTPEQLTLWQTAFTGENQHWNTKLHLPNPNPFIPTDFTLKAKEDEVENIVPSLLYRQSQVAMIHKLVKEAPLVEVEPESSMESASAADTTIVVDSENIPKEEEENTTKADGEQTQEKEEDGKEEVRL
jgi:secreted Zn-dependent insulinase-like peptidase